MKPYLQKSSSITTKFMPDNGAIRLGGRNTAVTT
jgi:hypothetical protein